MRLTTWSVVLKEWAPDQHLLELVRNASFWLLPLPTELETLGGGTQPAVF